jgi:hypothetical protein
MIEQFCHMPRRASSACCSVASAWRVAAVTRFQAKNMPTNAATAKPKFRTISKATESTAI